MGQLCSNNADDYLKPARAARKVCTPDNHIDSDFIFECNYRDCKGNDGEPVTLCNNCCVKDKKIATRRYCKLCAVSAQFDDKEDSEEKEFVPDKSVGEFSRVGWKRNKDKNELEIIG